MRALAWWVVACVASAVPAWSAAAQSRGSGVHWRGGIGWQMNVDGVSRSGQHSARVRLGIAPGRFEIAGEAAYAIPARADDGRSRIERARISIAATVAFVLLATRDLRLAIEEDVGLVGVRRETIALHDATLRPGAPHWTVAVLLGPGVRATWWIGHGAVGLEAAMGLDGLPGTRPLLYLEGEEAVVAYQPWVIQPRFGLGVIVRER